MTSLNGYYLVYHNKEVKLLSLAEQSRYIWADIRLALLLNRGVNFKCLSALDLFNHHKHNEIDKSSSTQIDDQMLNPEKSSDQQQEKEETKIDEMSVDNDHQMDIEM